MRILLRFIIAAITLIGLSNQADGLGIPAPPDIAREPSTSSKPAGFKALWEGHNSNAAQWTLDAQDAISKYAPDLIKGSSDVATFCPKYDRLGTQDRINFWVQLIAAMTKYESSFNPTSRFVESSMSNDPVTGKQTASEGLLQLSYSDGRNYQRVLPAGVCEFDYEADKRYSVKDLRRTILNPKNNLTCAIGILNHQVERDHLIAEANGAYWAVIKTDRPTNKLAQIRAITKALSFCQ